MHTREAERNLMLPGASLLVVRALKSNDRSRPMRRVLLVIVALVATIVAGSMTPAHADIRSRSDASGDALHQIDITRLTVRNGDHRVEMRIQVRDLRRRGTFSIHYWGG